MIYSNSLADKLLGCYIKNPELCISEKYEIDKDDFKVLFHKIIFVVCYNLAVEGYKAITTMDFEQWLEPYTSQFEIYKDNNGSEYIDTIIELVNEENFEAYYKEFRKYSCLNEYKEKGFDVSKFFDETKDDLSQFENLNKYSIEDIINYFEGLQIEVKRKYNRKVKEEYIAGTDFAESKERFKESPLVGNSFQSEYLNGIFRGMYGFILRVAKSGAGKSILSMGDLCKTTIKEYYDLEKGEFVVNKSRKGAGLFINTELDLRDELDPMIIAWISGVPRNHIIDGKYEDGEEERVDRAGEILLDSGLYVVDDPLFTTKSLTETIRDYAFNKGVKTVCFDYIQDNGFVSKELASETKVPQRPDMVLLALTDRLKQVQRECDIALISAVQTNGNEDNMENPNESCLAGGKSQVRKTDGTMIMLYPTKKEIDQLGTLIQKWNYKYNPNSFGNTIMPNNVIHIIKGRGSKYPKNIKVFQYIDLGTARTYDMFCTDKANNPIDVDKLVIEYEE